MSVTDEIKARLDIVELVGSYVQLKKTGRNFKGLCPFHNERTPSFVIFPDSQSWRCFGACGEGGDIFNFVMKREGWDFPDALRYLAEKAGVELEAFTPQQAEAQEAHDRLRALLADAAHFFHRRLLETPDAEFARQYVQGRGLAPETVETFAIGYAPDSWDAASTYLLDLGYQPHELVDAGMVVVRDEGGTYDRFRHRLVIPIRDSRGRVVGFGARALDPETEPKYINSPQSELFDKSGLLFGLDAARRTIRESEAAVIVEGYMDVIQAHQAGFADVVAQMGTALTEHQLRLLSRYASRLVLALDPDTAGQMATDRGREVIERVSKAAAQEAAQEGVWDFDAAEHDYHAHFTAEFDARGILRYEARLGFDIRVAVLPEGQDPDDLIREDPQSWAALVASAQPIVEYVIQKTVTGRSLDDPKVKAEVAEKIVPLINDVANAVERSHYRQRLARLLRVDERALFPDAGPSGKARPSRPSPSAPPPAAGMLPAALTLTPTAWREAFSLAALIQHPRLIYRVNRILAECMPILSEPALDSLAREVTAGDFAHPEHRTIFEAWRRALDQDEQEPLPYLFETLDPVSQNRLQGWLRQPLYALEKQVLPPASRAVSDDRVHQAAILALLDLRRQRLDEHIQELQFLIGDMDNGGDSLTIQEYGAIIRIMLVARKQLGQARIQYGLPGRKTREEEGGLPAPARS